MCLKMPLKYCKSIILCHVLLQHKQTFRPIAHFAKNGWLKFPQLLSRSSCETPLLLLENLKIRLKPLLVLRTRGNHPISRKSANDIGASNTLRQNRSYEVKFLVLSQKLKWMLKYCSYLKYFLINRLQRYSSRVAYMFRQISYLEPELRVFTGQGKMTVLQKFI